MINKELTSSQPSPSPESADEKIEMNLNGTVVDKCANECNLVGEHKLTGYAKSSAPCSKMSSPSCCRSQPESNYNTMTAASNTILFSADTPRGSMFKYNDPGTIFRPNNLYNEDGSSDSNSCSLTHSVKNACWYAKNHTSQIFSSSILVGFLAYFCLTLGFNWQKASRDVDFMVLTCLVILYKLTTSRGLKKYLWLPASICLGNAFPCFPCFAKFKAVKNSSKRHLNESGNSPPAYDYDPNNTRSSQNGNKLGHLCGFIFSHLYLVIALLTFGHLGYEVYKNPKSKLPPAGGIIILLFLIIIFTKNFKKIPWKTVITGLTLQILAADFIMNVKGGHYPFIYIGDKMKLLMDVTAEGCRFAFGNNFREHSFVFEALPLVIFLSSLISVFTYLGILDWIVNLGSLLFRWTMKTKKIESSCAMSNIFLGQVEALILFKQYLNRLTASELLACMLVGMGSISGTNYAIYLTFNISAVHLFAANIMAAPGALVAAKILMPDRENESIDNNAGDSASIDDKEDDKNDLNIPKDRNVIEAFTNGAATAVPIVACLLGIMIVFISMQALLNKFFEWFFSLAGLENFTFSVLISYIFLPFAWLIGIPMKECKTVATLLGTKFIAHEFLAYFDMKQTVDSGALSARAIIITTYALCGCTNLGSIGVQLGTISQLAPNKRSDIGKLVFIALYGSFMMNLINACIAAIVYNEQTILSENITMLMPMLNQAFLNATNLLNTTV